MGKEKDNQKDIQINSKTNSQVSFLRLVSLKTEKFSQALYLVTSHIPDGEPLKARIREMAIDLVSDSPMLSPVPDWSVSWSSDHEISPLFRVSVLESVLNNLHKIISLLQLAMAGSLISEINYRVLLTEFTSLESQLTQYLAQNGFAQNLVISDKEEKPMPRNYIGQESQKAVSTSPVLAHHSAKFSADHDVKKIYGQPDKGFKKNDEEKKASRRSEILGFLKDRDWTSIKDISESIKGCSVKTIQRELLDLVQKGILKKKGDRRWSRYLLA